MRLAPLRSFSLLSLLVLSLPLAACGPTATERAMERAIEEDTGGDADVRMENDGLSMTTKEGTATFGAKATLPADWPADVPMMPGATLQMAVDNASERAMAVSFLVDGSPQAVTDFYVAQLPGSGWEKQNTMEAGGMTWMTLTKEGRTLWVQSGLQDGKTMVSLGLVEEGADAE